MGLNDKSAADRSLDQRIVPFLQIVNEKGRFFELLPISWTEKSVSD